MSCRADGAFRFPHLTPVWMGGMNLADCCTPEGKSRAALLETSTEILTTTLPPPNEHACARVCVLSQDVYTFFSCTCLAEGCW